MSTLPFDQLATGLRAQAEGAYGAEAAAELLIAHGTWLYRRDFLDQLVHYDPHGYDDRPITWVDWPAVPAFAASAPCSTSEAQILRLAAELVDVDTGVPLSHLLTGLDARNSRLVQEAIAHVLTRGGGR